jgi:hypothetical protein
MLQLRGLASVSDAFVDCIAEHPGEDAMCRELHPQAESVIEMPDDYVGHGSICDTCDPATQWCDGSQCIPFTAEEQASWATAKPPTKVAMSPRPRASLIPGVSNTALAVVAGLGVLGFLAFKRTKQA